MGFVDDKINIPQNKDVTDRSPACSLLVFSNPTQFTAEFQNSKRELGGHLRIWGHNLVLRKIRTYISSLRSLFTQITKTYFLTYPESANQILRSGLWLLLNISSAWTENTVLNFFWHGIWFLMLILISQNFWTLCWHKSSQLQPSCGQANWLWTVLHSIMDHIQ